MKIIFIGAANPETIRIARAVSAADPSFEPFGFLDNDRAKWGSHFHGLPVLGGIDLIPRVAAEDVGFINLITGTTLARYQVTLDAVRLGAKLVNFIHPSVNLDMTSFGQGNYIQEGVLLQAGVEIGDNSSIHMGSLVGHESKIGHSTFVAHGVSISGCCAIGDGCFIGTNATILPRIQVGNWCTIGAGAVLTKHVPDYSVVVGNPGRIIRVNDVALKDGRIFP